MIHARKPSAEENVELQEMRRQAVGRVSQRAHMVLFSIQGKSVPEIATLCDYNGETTPSNNLVCRAEEKIHVSAIKR